MMMMIDDEFDVLKSIQFITVPFRLLFTGLITTLDITGKLPSADVLEKLNIVELTLN
jgi:hypothetical protein